MRLGVVGLGLMGGSWALAMRKYDLFDEFIGWDMSEDHRNQAVKLGLINQAVDSVELLLSSSDVIVMAIPVDSIEELLPDVLDQVKPGQLIVDFGSTKSAICDTVKDHPNRSQYLAAHPIAGTEYNGPGAAFSDLYLGKVMILCDTELTDLDLLEAFVANCQKLEMKISRLSSKEHDLHLAYVSHLSHVTSFSLSNAVLKIEKKERQILELAGSGFASTVRLAKSSPEMWTPIFLKNRTAILESVDAYLEELLRFRDHLTQKDARAIHEFLTEGRNISKILK